ncbi:HAD-IA family hydrolase [Pseudovibrio sp. Tun.PSC04-5.I4]|uniref:HAD family hydrolase n=1 Tax=Pseudovibrio sp. Tun.PSC04-5.I4 TaxID=1798213 RepID=UPI00087FD695|nr:HAD-IA family hydrolase [Pseudovibrio sp. Tun.PSC04-5.I4]SDQ15956.1 putative hydrolase of the HAD superfamily [Pseudovibrio sp. Tun.PSC04-5.I4]
MNISAIPLSVAEATPADIAKLVHDNAPVIRFDDNEPFLPTAAGYTLYQQDGVSVSSAHKIKLKGAAVAIEYAIWWDWDIQHLYELEHIWVYLSEAGDVLRVEGSAHGCAGELHTWDRKTPLEDGRVTLCSEPGKHAFAASSETLRANFAVTTLCCGKNAGKGTILVPDMFAAELGDLKSYDHHVARKYMESKAFKPAFCFDQAFDLRTVDLMPWDELKASVPARLRSVLAQLRKDAKGVKAVFLDSGDTLIDESSQIFVEGELVLSAVPIPGGDKLVDWLKERGYMVALVADGLVESFENVHKAMDFWHKFDARSVSEAVGVQKPDPRMFLEAVELLGLDPEDHSGCVMVGNNLERDIAGAKRLGMTSVWINWTPRYPKNPANADEVPDYTIGLPHQLLDVLADIDAKA